MLYLPKVMKPREVAKMLNVPTITVYKWLSRNLFPNAVRVGKNKWDIPETDVQTFVPPKGDVSRGAPKRGKRPRVDINLECTHEEFMAAGIRQPGFTARKRFLVLAYFASLPEDEWPDKLKAGQ